MGVVMKSLTCERDLVRFQKLAGDLIGVSFPIEFLKASRVRALCDEHNKLLGGYVLAPSENSRVIKSLPDEILSSNHILVHEREDIFEFTGLWLSPEIRDCQSCLPFWLTLYQDVITSRKKYFIYAYSAHKQRLGALYSVVKHSSIFTGETKLLPGMSCVERECIELGSVAKMIVAPVAKPMFLPKRFFSKLIKLLG
ncbi:MAG: hypothetical protein CL677_09085 [Bdellovibrionaceae bacterium]|nr:hypothetical protein [Pseudobdellovibrionaceae bacterium]